MKPLLILAMLVAGCPPAPPPPPPPPPVQHLVGMSWDQVGTPEYVVNRGTMPDALAPYDVTTAPAYTDVHVAAGGTYYYSVKSRDAAGNESESSNVVSATVPP